MSSPQSWQALEFGWIKCNVDAAFKPKNGTAASGVVLRDHDGRCCGGTTHWYGHCLDALTAETIACRDGLRYALKRGIRNLKMETDCQILVSLWKGRANQKSEVDSLLKEMEDLTRSFEAFELIFISRDCNRLAHECARLVSRDNQVVEWLITLPGLRGIVDNDCNSFHS